ncbi:MAG: hypothetical protein HKN24_04735 [Acidimicrobiales bacterium]|nr:hypothetical protein [Acidimicrobiales bacterium]
MNRRRRTFRALKGLLALMLVAATLTLSATPASAVPAVSITTAIGDRYVPGEPVTLLVEISATKATEGSIQVRIDGRETTSQPFDVAGGATKTFVVVSETLQWGGGVAVSVNSDDGDRTFRPRLAEDRESEQVGLLPWLQLADLPNTTPTATGNRTARIHPLTELLLAGPDGALDMFDSIAGAPQDFEALGPAALSRIQSWTARGGVLIVDAPAGSPVNGFAEAAAGRYGFGSLSFSDGTLGRGNASDIIPSTELSRFDEFENSVDPGQSGRLLVADAGIATPGIGLLLALIGGYILLVGPGLFLGLRRIQRQPLTWVAVPVMAFVTVSLVWGVGRAQRADEGLAHGTIVAYVDGVMIERSEVLVAASTGGFVGVDTSAGFTSVGGIVDRWGNITGRPLDRRDDSVGVNLNPGEATRLTLQRVSTPSTVPPLSIEVHELTNKTLLGTVTNTGPLELSDVRVVAGNALDLIGTMTPGESAGFELDSSFAAIPLAEDNLFARMEGGFFDPFQERAADESAVNAGALANFTREFRRSRATGHVLALGWTRDLPAPVRNHEGRLIDRGRTGLLSVQPIGNVGGTEVAYGEASAELHRMWDFELNDVANGFGEFPSEILYTLPSGADPNAPYVIEFSDQISGIDIWDGSSWSASSRDAIDSGVGSSIIPLERDSTIRNGRVHLRTGFRGFVVTAPIPVVRSATVEELEVIR